MITVTSGYNTTDLETLKAAIAKCKTVPQVCRAVGWKYSPTADYAVTDAIKKYNLDASHFLPRRERKTRALGGVHDDTKAVIDGFIESIPRPDSRASYKYILYNFAEALDGGSVLHITPEQIEEFISTLPNEAKQKYTSSCVKAAFTWAFKEIEGAKDAISKEVLFWILGV